MAEETSEHIEKNLKKEITIFTHQSVALDGLFLIAIFFVLYFARELFLPIFFAFIFYFLLYPIVAFLKRTCYIPKFLGAVIIILVLLFILSYGIYYLSREAKEWIDNAPHLEQILNQRLAKVSDFIKRPFPILGEILHGSTGPNVQPGWINTIFSNTWNLLIEFFAMLILLYFLLASENFFLKKIISALVTSHKKREANAVVMQIEQEVWKYLFTRTLINIGVAIFVSLMLWAYRIPNPILWGVMAGILEFIPFIGGCISLIVITIVCIVSFDNIWHIILPPISFFVFISLEGNLLVPYVLGRSFVLNQVAVILAIFLMGWMWGAMGTFLAIPLLMTMKIIYDNINKNNLLNELIID